MSSAPSDQNEITKIEKQSARLTMNASELQARIAKADGQGSWFLDKLPRELRDKIYSYLLVNPVLGESWSIINHDNDQRGSKERYDLHPTILRTCKTIYEEASKTLYESNAFFTVCINSNEKSRPGPWFVSFCPLTRHRADGTTQKYERMMSDIGCMKKVRQWNVLMCRLREQGTRSGKGRFLKTHPWSLAQFCQTVRWNSQATVTVMVSPNISAHGRYSLVGGQSKLLRLQHLLDGTLQPLHLLRQIDDCKVRWASREECTGLMVCLDQHEGFTYRHYELRGRGVWEDMGESVFDEENHELQSLVVKDLPAHSLVEMYSALLVYSQAFERCSAFKTAMGLERDQTVADVYGTEYESGLPPTLLSENPYRRNVGRIQLCHPIEGALSRAKRASREGNTEFFVQEREIVLNNLEHQYRKIVQARESLRLFVGEQNKQGGLFEAVDSKATFASPLPLDAGQAIALTYLKDYAAAFRRDTDRFTRAHIMKIQSLFNSAYNSMTREKVLRELTKCVELGSFEGFEEDFRSDFTRNFKRAADDMEDQYLEIQTTRKQLFDWDFSDDCRKLLELDTNQCDERISWKAEKAVLSAAEIQILQLWEKLEEPTEEPWVPSDTTPDHGLGWDTVNTHEWEWMSCSWGT